MQADAAPAVKVGAVDRDAIRVLFLIGGLGPGGAEAQARLLLTKLPAAGVSVRLGCFGGYERELDLVSAAGVPIDLFAEARGRLWPVKVLWRINGIIRRHRINIVQTFLSSFDILAPFLRLLSPGVRLITSRRTIDEALPPRDIRLLRQTGRFVQAIVANSAAVAESVQRIEGHAPPRLRVVPNGIPLPAALSAEERALGRQTHGVSDQELVVTYIAHFRAGKGHRYIPEVARKVINRMPRTCFLLAGETDVNEVYRGIAAGLQGAVKRDRLQQHIRVLGPVSDVRNLLAAADLSLNLSDYEGMSNAVLEAMALGVPVVAADSGGTKEIITHGADGWLVPRADAAAAAEGILKIAGDPDLRRKLGGAGRRRIARDFSVERMVERYVSLYRELV